MKASQPEAQRPSSASPSPSSARADEADMPPPALKHDSSPPSEDKEKAQVTFAEPQASKHDPDSPDPPSAPTPQPPSPPSDPLSSQHASASSPTPSQPSSRAAQHGQQAEHPPAEPPQRKSAGEAGTSDRPDPHSGPHSSHHHEGRHRPKHLHRGWNSQDYSWIPDNGRQESLPSPFVSADLDSFDPPLDLGHSHHPPTVPESGSEPASDPPSQQMGTVHASEPLTTLASGQPGAETTAEAGKTPEEVSAEAATRQQQHPAQQPVSRADHGWDFGGFAPKPKKMSRGTHSRSQSRDIEAGRADSPLETSEAEGQQVARDQMPQLAPEMGSPAISGFPLGPRGMVPWLGRRKDSKPGSSLPQRSMVSWDASDDEMQLPR